MAPVTIPQFNHSTIQQILATNKLLIDLVKESQDYGQFEECKIYQKRLASNLSFLGCLSDAILLQAGGPTKRANNSNSKKSVKSAKIGSFHHPIPETRKEIVNSLPAPVMISVPVVKEKSDLLNRFIAVPPLVGIDQEKDITLSKFSLIEPHVSRCLMLLRMGTIEEEKNVVMAAKGYFSPITTSQNQSLEVESRESASKRGGNYVVSQEESDLSDEEYQQSECDSDDDDLDPTMVNNQTGRPNDYHLSTPNESAMLRNDLLQSDFHNSMMATEDRGDKHFEGDGLDSNLFGLFSPLCSGSQHVNSMHPMNSTLPDNGHAIYPSSLTNNPANNVMQQSTINIHQGNVQIRPNQNWGLSSEVGMNDHDKLKYDQYHHAPLIPLNHQLQSQQNQLMTVGIQQQPKHELIGHRQGFINAAYPQEINYGLYHYQQQARNQSVDLISQFQQLPQEQQMLFLQQLNTNLQNSSNLPQLQPMHQEQHHAHNGFNNQGQVFHSILENQNLQDELGFRAFPSNT